MSIFSYKVTDIDGDIQDISQYKGNVMLIVNTASKCGFTPQYQGLEELYQKHKDNNLVILGFPCNQFNSQEPEDEAGIKNFCELNYGVSFPMFSKIDVNGKNAHELFVHLRKELSLIHI